jgi:hypothetical protein
LLGPPERSVPPCNPALGELGALGETEQIFAKAKETLGHRALD